MKIYLNFETRKGKIPDHEKWEELTVTRMARTHSITGSGTCPSYTFSPKSSVTTVKLLQYFSW